MVSEREIQRNVPLAYRYVINLVGWFRLKPGRGDEAEEAALDIVVEALKRLLYEREALEQLHSSLERAEYADDAERLISRPFLMASMEGRAADILYRGGKKDPDAEQARDPEAPAGGVLEGGLSG